jgi:hypothetical protein
MAANCPTGLNVARLREGVSEIYDRVARNRSFTE